MSGCRDCTTCTQPGAVRASISTAIGLIHISTAGISWVVKRAVAKHCPNCRHMLSSHQQRPDLPGWQTSVTGALPQQPHGHPAPSQWGQPPRPGAQQPAPWPPQQQTGQPPQGTEPPSWPPTR
ncbi:hypothetical protein GCM10009738_64780 [Kitasatospora viridis]